MFETELHEILKRMYVQLKLGTDSLVKYLKNFRNFHLHIR